MSTANNAASAVVTGVKLLNAANVMLDLLEQRNISMKRLVEMRAAVQREGREFNESDWLELESRAQKAIDSILE